MTEDTTAYEWSVAEGFSVIQLMALGTDLRGGVGADRAAFC